MSRFRGLPYFQDEKKKGVLRRLGNAVRYLQEKAEEQKSLPLYARRLTLAVDFGVMILNVWLLLPVLLYDSGFTALQTFLCFCGIFLAGVGLVLFPAFSPPSRTALRWSIGALVCFLLFFFNALALFTDYHANVLWENVWEDAAGTLPLPVRLAAAGALFFIELHLLLLATARRQYLAELDVFFVPGRDRSEKVIDVIVR